MRKQPDDCARPMDFTSLVEVNSHRAQRVFEAARHLPRKAAVTFAHFSRGIPIGSGLFSAYGFGACPVEALAADRDRVRIGFFVRQNIIGLAPAGIDHHGARRKRQRKRDDRRRLRHDIGTGTSAAGVSALLTVFTFRRVFWRPCPDGVRSGLPSAARKGHPTHDYRHVLWWWWGTAAPPVRCASANQWSEQMSTASGPSEYRSSAGEIAAHTDGIMDEVSDRVSTLTSDVVCAIEERPYTSLAIASGLAFALGALWVLKRQQQHSSFERLRSQVPSFSDAGDWLPRRWRSSAGIDWAKLRPSRWA